MPVWDRVKPPLKIVPIPGVLVGRVVEPVNLHTSFRIACAFINANELLRDLTCDQGFEKLFDDPNKFGPGAFYLGREHEYLCRKRRSPLLRLLEKGQKAPAKCSNTESSPACTSDTCHSND